MADKLLPVGNMDGVSEIPTTVGPQSLLLSNSSHFLHTSNSAPIPAPPVPNTILLAPSVISRPPKRYVRPRATTESEKRVRLEERKEANRTAAKQSRERQKVAMDEALRENERLTKENTQLLSRLSNLE